jgi:uncharacterized membrane protein
MTYSPLLLIHICGGIAGFLSGATALVVRKGAALHRTTGKVFAISMMCMAASGGYLAFMKSESLNVLAGAFTFYLVASAWLTVTRKEKEIGRAELVLLLLALVIGGGGWIAGLQAARSGAPSEAAESATYFVFGTFALLAAAGDVRMHIRGGVSGGRRLARHLWRMCIALFIATGSFFLGTASDPVLRRTGLRARLFSPAVRHTHLPEVPVLIVVLLTIFWLFRVRFSRAYRTAEA